MTLVSLGEYALFVLIVVALVRPVGTYLDLVFSGRRTPLVPALVPVERAIHRLAGVDPRRGMDWREYALSFVLFGVAGTAVLFLVLTLQPNHTGGAGVGAPRRRRASTARSPPVPAVAALPERPAGLHRRHRGPRQRQPGAGAAAHRAARGHGPEHGGHQPGRPRQAAQAHPAPGASSSAEEARAFLAAAAEDGNSPHWHPALYTGMRPSESEDLRWESLDLEAGTLRGERVRPTAMGRTFPIEATKSASGARTLALPPSMVGLLRPHRARQRESLLLAGAVWGERGLVCCSRVGTPLDHANVLGTSSPCARKQGCPGSACTTCATARSA